jgi:TolB-like protein/Tfp pilus assembly protein PilF
VQFVFGDYTLDTATRELLCGASAVAVEPQVFDLLTYLVQTRDRVVSKDDLIASVWGGRIVSDSTLASRINAARKAVGDSGEAQKLIRTITRKGVRFIGEVQHRMNAGDAGPAPADTDHLRLRPALPRPDRPAIAVLPFVSMSDDSDQDHFADGISEDIITALSKLRWFFVVARNSSFSYKGKSAHIQQIAAELGVGYIVEGSVRKSGDRVRITAQLNDAVTGGPIWAERYDRALADVFAVQDEITEAIVGAIEPQVYAAENFRARRKPPGSLDAWDFVMQALSHFWRLTSEDNVAAQTLLKQAIAIDPNYGQAYGVLAFSHGFGAQMGWEDRAFAAGAADCAANQAVRADSEDAWAHLAMACARVGLRRYDDAVAEFETTLRLNPNFALAQGYYGLLLTYCGRWREARAAANRALRLSPRDPLTAIYTAIAGYAEFVGRNYEEAMRLGRESVRERPDFAGGYRVLISAAAMAGEIEIATAALEKLRRAQPNISLAWIAAQLPIKDPAERDHYVDAFRRAGLT